MSARNVAFPGTLTVKSAQSLPATTTATLYTQSGDSILVTGLMGVVTSAIGATATNLSLGTTASNTAIGTATAVTSLAAGDWLFPSFSAGIGSAIVTTSRGGVGVLPALEYTATPFMLAAGSNITWTTSATDTGAITWYCWWIPLGASATLS